MQKVYVRARRAANETCSAGKLNRILKDANYPPEPDEKVWTTKRKVKPVEMYDEQTMTIVKD